MKPVALALLLSSLTLLSVFDAFADDDRSSQDHSKGDCQTFLLPSGQLTFTEPHLSVSRESAKRTLESLIRERRNLVPQTNLSSGKAVAVVWDSDILRADEDFAQATTVTHQLSLERLLALQEQLRSDERPVFFRQTRIHPDSFFHSRSPRTEMPRAERRKKFLEWAFFTSLPAAASLGIGSNDFFGTSHYVAAALMTPILGMMGLQDLLRTRAEPAVFVDPFLERELRQVSRALSLDSWVHIGFSSEDLLSWGEIDAFDQYLKTWKDVKDSNSTYTESTRIWEEFFFLSRKNQFNALEKERPQHDPSLEAFFSLQDRLKIYVQDRLYPQILPDGFSFDLWIQRQTGGAAEVTLLISPGQSPNSPETAN